jgi:hypothetical protein
LCLDADFVISVASWAKKVRRLLCPTNQTSPTIIRPQGELRLIGVVTGLARRLKKSGR